MLSVTCFCRVLGVELDLRSKPPSQSLHNVERKEQFGVFTNIGIFRSHIQAKKTGGQVTIDTFGRGRVAIPCNR